MNDLEARQLRYFVAVAEELNFGRAAERLGMTQPPLSRAVRRLERQLGVRLLERTTRQVALTPAGTVFLRDARTALEAIDAAGRRARHAARSAPRLRLAMKADTDAGLLPRILSAYQDEDAALAVELVLGGRGEQAQALREGRADVGLLVTPFDDRDLDVEPLLTEPRVVALASTDPLAHRPSLRLADLAERVLPDGTPADREEAPPPGAGRVNGGRGTSAAQPGLVAGTQRRVTDLTQILSLVELGGVVCFPTTSVARRYQRPEIAYRPVSDLAPATLSVAWPQNARSAAVAAFVRAAVSVAAAAQADEELLKGAAAGPSMRGRAAQPT